MLNPDHFKSNYIRDESHLDTEKVNYLGKEFLLGDLRALFESTKERRYHVVIFYDDIMQYTSLGLLEEIYKRFDIDSPIPVKPFLSRTIPEGKQYLIEHLKPFEVSEIAINAIENECYKDIIHTSPRSKNFHGIWKMREIFSKVTLVFKYEFPEIEQIIRLFSRCYERENYNIVETVFRRNRSEYEFLKTLGKYQFDIIFCCNAAGILDFIQETKLNDTIIVSSYKHCGLNEDEKAIIAALEMGPCKSSLHYITEGL